MRSSNSGSTGPTLKAPPEWKYSRWITAGG
jgi:hypothetical protein